MVAEASNISLYTLFALSNPLPCCLFFPSLPSLPLLEECVISLRLLVLVSPCLRTVPSESGVRGQQMFQNKQQGRLIFYGCEFLRKTLYEDKIKRGGKTKLLKTATLQTAYPISHIRQIRGGVNNNNNKTQLVSNRELSHLDRA